MVCTMTGDAELEAGDPYAKGSSDRGAKLRNEWRG